MITGNFFWDLAILLSAPENALTSDAPEEEIITTDDGDILLTDDEQ